MQRNPNSGVVVLATALAFLSLTAITRCPVSRLMAADAADGGVSAGEATTQWPQWGGSGERNNTPVGKNIPAQWDIGGFQRRTNEWIKDDAENIKWVSRVGSQTYGNPVVADGQIYVGTNNGAGYLARYPNRTDLGCMLAFREADGLFLWQHSSEKLPTGRVHDWPLQGICCAPLVDGDRLWYVSSRGEVVCVDTQGFYDDQDDGPLTAQWGRLFQEKPTIESGLDDGDLSDALRASLAESGVSLEGRLSVASNTEGQDWRVTVRDTDGTSRFYALRLKEGQLTVHQLETEESQPTGGPRLQVAALLTDGLADGEVSSGLRALLAQRGMSLPEEVKVSTGESGGWMLTAEVDGNERKIRVARTGPNLTAFKQITTADKHEADTVWTVNMMKDLGVSQHNMCSCSVTALGDILFVNTSNGVDESHINLPALDAPSFIAVDKNTGDVLWTDKSPGTNILHGQWSSPAVGVLDGVAQVLFAGGDGWVYSFRADAGKNGSPELLWKFDANPKESQWILGGRGTRNNIIATPVLYDGRVYVAVGQDPEHGEGIGHLWCIDPTKRGDVSPQLAMKLEGNRRVSIPHRRLQAVDPTQGEIAMDNPNSAVVWHYSQFDQNGDGKFDFEEVMHRSCGTVAIKDDILYIADFSGLLHCLGAQTGKVHWTYDMLAAAWGSPLIVDGKVYIGDEDGDVCVFQHATQPQEPLAENYMNNSVYSTPVVANNVLYISNKTHLFAIQQQAE